MEKIQDIFFNKKHNNKFFAFIFCFFLIVSPTYAQWEWVNNTNFDASEEVVLDYLGNTYTSSHFTDNRKLLVKTAPDGSIIWTLEFVTEFASSSILHVTWDVDSDYSLFVSSTFGNLVKIRRFQGAIEQQLLQYEVQYESEDPNHIYLCKISLDGDIKWFTESNWNENKIAGHPYDFRLTDLEVIKSGPIANYVAVAVEYSEVGYCKLDEITDKGEYSCLEYAYPEYTIPGVSNTGIKFPDLVKSSFLLLFQPKTGEQLFDPFDTDYYLGAFDFHKLTDYVENSFPNFTEVSITNIKNVGDDDHIYVTGVFKTIKNNLPKSFIYCTKLRIDLTKADYKWTNIINWSEGENIANNYSLVDDLNGNNSAAYLAFSTAFSTGLRINNAAPPFAIPATIDPKSFLIKFNSETGVPEALLSCDGDGPDNKFSAISVAKSKAESSFWITGSHSSTTKIQNHPVNPNNTKSVTLTKPAQGWGIFLAKVATSNFEVLYSESIASPSPSPLYNHPTDIIHVDKTVYLTGEGLPGLAFGGTASPVVLENGGGFLAKRGTKDTPDPVVPDPGGPSNPDRTGPIITATPNPTTSDNVQLIITANQNEEATVTLRSSVSIVYSKQYKLQVGQNPINLSQLALVPGAYTVTVSTSTGLTNKFLIIN